MNKKICIIGSGGFGREVLETLKEINKVEEKYEILGFIDDDVDKKDRIINGYPVLGTIEQLKKDISLKMKPLYAALAIADAGNKERITDFLGESVLWDNIIHPTAIIADTCEMGRGNLFQANSWVGPNTKIGNFCMLNIGSTLGHDVVFGDYVSVMSKCDITGWVVLKDKVYVASSVSIIPNCVVGESAKLGAGAVIMKDVPPGATMHGYRAVEYVKERK